ncbi:hypothetical protein MC885_012481 [Smutsia gigantea]|nr:hypothetical protein MC885_012481 [Smutsia gigantea]
MDKYTLLTSPNYFWENLVDRVEIRVQGPPEFWGGGSDVSLCGNLLCPEAQVASGVLHRNEQENDWLKIDQTVSAQGKDGNIHLLQESVKELRAESKKYFMLKGKNEELINDCSPLKERMNHSENGKKEQEVEPAAPQEKLEHLRENDNASCRRQMELRIKDLESQLSKKISQRDYIKTELEKYRQFYREEVKIIESLANQLKTNERVEEINTKLGEKQKRSSLSTLSTRPVLEPNCVGNLMGPGLGRDLNPRENVVIRTSNCRTSGDEIV